MKLPKLLIIGESGCGKDELCKILADHFGYRFASASLIACEIVAFEKLKDKYSYATVEECHADRRNHIPEWVDIIAEYNTPDGAALTRQVMHASDIYCGVRKRSEYDAMIKAKLFDCIIYIDAYKRLGQPEKSYVEVTADDAHFTVDNNADIKQLVQKTKRAHARAMQIMQMRKPTYNEQGSETITRDDLVKATEEEKQQLMAEAKAEQGEVIDMAEDVVKQVDALDDAVTETVVKPVEHVAPKAQLSRPPKAPAKRTVRKPRSK